MYRLFLQHIRYKNYGGRGITVCAHICQKILERIFPSITRPTGMTIDRIDNDGNYEPGNCRWATAQQQARNQQRHKRVRSC
jgi:hypothetical protein